MPNSTRACLPSADKKMLRRCLRAARASIPPEEAARAATAATAFLLADPLWQAARRVALYMALPDELPTVPLIKEAWAKSKGVFLPRCLAAPASPAFIDAGSQLPPKKNPGRMVFARCESLADLAPATLGIHEPLPHCPVLAPEQGDALPDLLLMPAVGLDARGTRLGYGGGYYDNLLQNPAWAAVPRIGYVFACQLVPLLPREPWDQPVHALLTEEGLTWL